MRFDHTALRTRIKERFGTYRSFASALGISNSTLYRWLQENGNMPCSAIFRMAEILEIPDREVETFFFALRPDFNVLRES